jgi:hypothetical protein
MHILYVQWFCAGAETSRSAIAKQSVCLNSEADKTAVYTYSKVNLFHGAETRNFMTVAMVH